MSIAAFEAIPTDDIYGAISDIEGQPINDQFEKVGFEHHLLFHNFGTLGLVIACLPVIYLLYGSTGFCDRFKTMRRQRKKLAKNLFYGWPIRIMIESYVIGVICILLNVKTLDLQGETTWVSFNSFMSLIMMCIFSLFPIYSIGFMLYNFDQLKEKKM